MKIILIFLVSLASVIAQNDIVKTYYDNNNVMTEITFENGIRNGKAVFYYEDGTIKTEMEYENGRVIGNVNHYFDNGNLRESFFIEDGRRIGPTFIFNEEGELIEDHNYEYGKLVRPQERFIPESIASTDTEIKEVEKVEPKQTQQVRRRNDDLNLPPAVDDLRLEDDPAFYATVEIEPEPVGGMEYIINRLYYPPDARKKKIEGVVKVRAFIDRYGEVLRTEVIEGLGYGLDESAEIAIYYTRFKPGILRGKPVNVQMIIPIEFNLEEYLNRSY